MRQTERENEYESALRAAFHGFQTGLWSACPGIVESYDPNDFGGTCSVQPAIQGVYTDPATGTATNVNLPVLTNCPVVYIGGGNYVSTFPITEGDECLVVFSSRCIDAHIQSGGIQKQAELRMHDLSDGFVIVGHRSAAKKLSPAASIDGAEIRSLDRTQFVQLKAGQITLCDPALVVIQAPLAHFTGNVQIDGDADISGTTTGTKDGVFKTVSVHDHTHTLTQPGDGDSGPPNT